MLPCVSQFGDQNFYTCMSRLCKQVSISRDIAQSSKIDQTISLILNLFNPHLSVFENTIDPDQLASSEVHYKKGHLYLSLLLILELSTFG